MVIGLTVGDGLLLNKQNQHTSVLTPSVLQFVSLRLSAFTFSSWPHRSRSSLIFVYQLSIRSAHSSWHSALLRFSHGVCNRIVRIWQRRILFLLCSQTMASFSFMGTASRTSPPGLWSASTAEIWRVICLSLWFHRPQKSSFLIWNLTEGI